MTEELCALGARRFAGFALIIGAAASCGQSRLQPFTFLVLDASLGEQPSVDALLEAQPSDAGSTDAPGDGPTVDVPIVVVCPPDQLVGYATLGAATTGGGKPGMTVTASSLTELTAYAAELAPMVIQVSRPIAATEPIPVMSDKTIEGLVHGAGLIGGGLNLKDSHNVIVRNLSISLVKHPNDAVHLENSKNVWIDHCDLSSSLMDPKGTYDGLVDIAHASDFVTVSWNKFSNHYLTSLVGHSASNAAEDTGHLTVTYHHNWFQSAQSYDPRVRFGLVHVFNNFYDGNTDYEQGAAIVSTMYAQVLVEGNVFKNVKVPISSMAAADDTADGTIWDMTTFGNIYDNTSGANQITVLKEWTPPYANSYFPDRAVDVEGLVTHCAGQRP